MCKHAGLTRTVPVSDSDTLENGSVVICNDCGRIIIATWEGRIIDPYACDVCDLLPVVFVASFPDGTKFDLCEGCTNDLCNLQPAFILDVVVSVKGEIEDEEPFWTDPAEQ